MLAPDVATGAGGVPIAAAGTTVASVGAVTVASLGALSEYYMVPYVVLVVALYMTTSRVLHCYTICTNYLY